MRLLEPRHPNRLDAPHPRIVEDLLEIAHTGHQEALDAIILMLKDLTQQGLESRFAKTLKGTPIWELKTRSRGGLKGGSRLYWFPLEVSREDSKSSETFAVIVNAEVKAGNTPNPLKLMEALEVYLAFKRDALGMIRRSG
jgi:hypothetical protein